MVVSDVDPVFWPPPASGPFAVDSSDQTPRAQRALAEGPPPHSHGRLDVPGLSGVGGQPYPRHDVNPPIWTLRLPPSAMQAHFVAEAHGEGSDVAMQ